MRPDMTGRPLDVDEPTPEQAVRYLTRELANYLERIHSVTGGWAGDLYALVLAVSGSMTYAEPGASHAPLGVPDAPLHQVGTRFALWQQALEQVLDILGDPESFYRTGFDSQALSAAMRKFFAAPRAPGPYT